MPEDNNLESQLQMAAILFSDWLKTQLVAGGFLSQEQAFPEMDIDTDGPSLMDIGNGSGLLDLIADCDDVGDSDDDSLFMGVDSPEGSGLMSLTADCDDMEEDGDFGEDPVLRELFGAPDQHPVLHLVKPGPGVDINGISSCADGFRVAVSFVEGEIAEAQRLVDLFNGLEFDLDVAHESPRGFQAHIHIDAELSA